MSSRPKRRMRRAEEPEGDGEGRASGNLDDEDIGRTDDPVRMYLREMGSVELLSREGEIAIAKRIEAGREMMIGGICESPLTMRALIGWRDALNESRMLLRDIVDLDATYGNKAFETEEAAKRAAVANGEDPKRRKLRPRQPSRARGADAEGADGEEGDAEENAISLAAMEAELKPGVLAILDEIASLYKKLQKRQDSRLKSLNEGEELGKSSEQQLRQAQRPDRRGDEECAPQQRPHRAARRSALRPQPPPGDRRGQAAADGRSRRRQAPGLPQPSYRLRADPDWVAGKAAARQGLVGLVGKHVR